MAIRRYLNVFGNTVPWYGICLVVALALMAICLYINLRKRLPSSDDETLFLLTFPLMCIFGVLAAILIDAAHTGDWRTWFGGGDRKFGLTFTGFLIGSIAFLVVYGRLSGLGGKFLMNVFLPPLAIAQAVGRVGCFLGGCCYGIPCSHGIAYPSGSMPFEIVGGVALLPIQLIESLFLLCLSYALLKTAFGWRAYVYVIGASAIRFVTEFFRYDNRGMLFGVKLLSPQQILSIVLMAAFGILLLNGKRRVKWA